MRKKMLIDLHVRTPVSEGDPDVESLLHASAEFGLDGVCIVGDGTPPDIDEAHACPDAGSLALFFGIEFEVENGRLIWIPSDTAAFESDRLTNGSGDSLTMEEVAGIVGDLGGVLIAVHPYDRSREPLFRDDVYDAQPIHAIQISNANLAQTPNELAIEAAVKLKKSSVGGTGPLRSSRSVGRSATVFLETPKDQADLVSIVKSGDVWAVEFLDRIGGRGRGRRRSGGRPQSRENGNR